MVVKCFIGLILISWVVAFSSERLLLAKECTFGPSFWCENIKNAKKCNAVKHCIQTVWEHKNVPEDLDDICTVCKKMVTEARNQLESNETLNEIKEVFEGTCKLIHIKPLIKNCIALADEYAPELVDMLSSQMNPNVICSVVGLCNNANIDRMLEDASSKKEKDEERTAELRKDCESCMNFAESVAVKIEKATDDEIKSYFLEKCRSFGSFSDACSTAMKKYSDDLISNVRSFTPLSLCYLTSTCVNGFARKVHVKTESDVGVIHFNNDAVSVAVKHLSEDESCEFCKQMVKHLKDVLVSNTTELEFEHVLKGLCRQTGKFKGECLAFADEYYGKIYDFLVNDINGKELCTFVGICKRGSVFVNGSIFPLLPKSPEPIPENATHVGGGFAGRISVDRSESNVRVLEFQPQSTMKVEISFGDPLESRFQLPIERMMIPQNNDVNVNNKATCEFCQYLLHYIQKAISQPYGENELKKMIDKVCERLPNSITVECKNFVEQFGDAFVAILAQEIDPSQVCPALHICPATVLQDRYEPQELVGKPGCPLCLMAVEEIIDKLQNNRTEDSIRQALKSLCQKMPSNLKSQCIEFVQSHTEEIIDMLIADFTPQEVCTYLKLCHVNVDVEVVTAVPLTASNYEIFTNEILRDSYVETEKGRAKSVDHEILPTCILCEFVMDKVADKLRRNFTETEIETALGSVCRQMPQTVRFECKLFLKKYSHFIVELLSHMTEPDMVCSTMHMCRETRGDDFHPSLEKQIQRGVEQCAMCEALVGAIRALFQDKSFDRNVSRYATKICNSFPYSRRDKCKSMVMSYGPSIINLLVELEVRPERVCQKIELCDVTEQAKVVVQDSSEERHPQQRPHLLGGNSCTWGPSFWCQSEDHARTCGTLAHCREMVWKADSPPAPAA